MTSQERAVLRQIRIYGLLSRRLERSLSATQALPLAVAQPLVKRLAKRLLAPMLTRQMDKLVLTRILPRLIGSWFDHRSLP